MLKKKLMTCCASLLIATAAITAPIVVEVEPVEASTVIYDDFDQKQYWASSMQWMIDHGYITGYINQKHPTTGQWGTWLDPNGPLKEGQMLSVLLRYKLGIEGYSQMLNEFEDEIQYPPYKNNWLYPIYAKAAQLGIPYSKFLGNDQVTRRELARALVSMHYDEYVNLQQAVDFMFANKITSGTKAYAKPTISNFNPNEKLSRAHISAFLKRYHDVLTSGNVIDTLNDPTYSKEKFNGYSCGGGGVIKAGETPPPLPIHCRPPLNEPINLPSGAVLTDGSNSSRHQYSFNRSFPDGGSISSVVVTTQGSERVMMTGKFKDGSNFTVSYMADRDVISYSNFVNPNFIKENKSLFFSVGSAFARAYGMR